MIKFAKIFVFAFALFALVSCTQGNALEIGDNAPEFSLKDINGKTVSLSDFRGRAVILNFFASWCPPCRQEVPDFIELEKAYGDKGFSMVGVALVTARDAKDFSAKYGINYPVLVDDGKVSSVYGPIRSIPTTFILDKSGKIVKLYIGFRSRDVFEADIKELLK